MSILEAEELARTELLKQEKNPNYRCYAARAAGSQEGSWFFQFRTPEGKFCDVHVMYPKKEIVVGSTVGHGSMPRAALQHPIGDGLEKARARLGPREEEFFCVAAYYDDKAGDWTYFFQDADPRTTRLVGVSPDGNVRGFIEMSSNSTSTDANELIADLPEKKSDELPYGSEELKSSELKVESKAGNLVASLPVVCLPEGFTAIETGSSVMPDGTYVLVYRVRYRFSYGGVGREKDAVWKLKKPDSGVPKFRVIHKPDQVVVKPENKRK